MIAALAGRGTVTESLVEEGLSLVHLLVADVPTARELLNLSRFIWLATAGRADEARATVDAEVERSAGRSAIAGSWLAMRSLGIQATALAQMNRPADARRVLDQVEENWRSETKALLMSELAEAWMLVMAGRSQVAARRCTAAARVAFDAQHAPLAVFAAHDAARFGHPSIALPVLVDAASTVEGDLIPALVAHARALDAADTDALLELAVQLPGWGSRSPAPNARPQRPGCSSRARNRRPRSRRDASQRN